MRVSMGIFKNRHGTWFAQQRVPADLQEAVARVLGDETTTRKFLKKSLGTPDRKEAQTRAATVLLEFSQTLAKARALVADRPVRSTLSAIEIKRIAEAHYALMLEGDEVERREGTGSEPIFQSVAKQLAAAGVEFNTPFSTEPHTRPGLSDREIIKRQETTESSRHILGAGK
jgi:hypothetical protein